MKWKIDGQVVNHDSGYPTNVPNGNNPSLRDTIGQHTITPSWNIHGAVLECSADHNELSSPLIHSLTIDVKVPPTSANTNLTHPTKPEGYLPGDSAIVNESTEEQFTCIVEGSRPTAQIIWYVGSLPPNEGVIHTDTEQNPDDPLLFDTKSTLTFVPRRIDHYYDLKCVASVQVAGTVAYTFDVRLVVHGIPDSPTLTGEYTATEFDVHELRCDANNGLPAGQIFWYLKDTDITNSSVQTNTDNAAFRVDMRSVLSYVITREANGEDIRCEVRHPNLEAPPFPADSITMNVKFCPETVTFTECPANIIEGNIDELPCFSGSSNPSAIIDWFTNGEATNSTHDPTYSDGEYNGKVTTQKLTTEELTRRDLGIEFKCCAVNLDVSCGIETCDECHPEVYYSPNITAFQIPIDPTLEFDIVSLTCTLDSNPNPTVQWLRDSVVVAVFENVEDVSTLTLTIARSMAGVYQCIADNSIDDVEESELKPLTVHYKPNITSKSQDLWRPRPLESVTILCKAIGNVLPTFSWDGPGGPISVNDTERFKLEETIELIDDVRGSVITGYLTIMEFYPPLDDGLFTCSSDNYLGRDTHSIRVEEARVPEIPSSVEFLAELSSYSSITVSWKPGDDGGFAQWFLVVYRINEDNEEFGSEIEIRNDTKVEIRGLESNTEYEIAVMAENDIGRSDGMESIFGWTFPAPHDELGVTVTYTFNVETNVGIVNIAGLVLGSTVCVQLEVRYDDGDTWEPIGECYSSNSDHFITENAKYAQFRSQLCGKESNLCGEYVEAAHKTTGDDNNNNIAVILSATLVPLIVLILLVVLVVVYRRNRQQPNVIVHEAPPDANQPAYEIPPDAGPRVYYNPPDENEGVTLNAVPNDYDRGRREDPYVRPFPNVPEFVELFADKKHTIKPGELKLQKEIGKGHFATVYRGKCTSKAGDEIVAIKVLTVKDDSKRSEEVTNEAIANMAKELRNTLKLTAERHNMNPNIVHTYGWSFDRSHGAEQILLVMEYLGGGTLEEFVKDRAHIGEALYYRFAYQIANGMEFLESQKPPIIHRDLAARNVLLDSKKGNNITCKVADFGLARATSGEDSIYVIEMGGVDLPTRWYSIESLYTKEFTTKSDVWSFGILLWEMTSGGDVPYRKMGISNNLLLSKLKQGTRLTPPESMPKDMIPLMESCWLANPDERPTFRELKEKLGNV